jgi:predicted oxidoreductase
MSLIDPSPRSLGSFDVGPIGFGCWRFTHSSVSEATSILEAALEAGMNLIDTADVYGLDWGGTGFGLNEELLGKVLAASPGLRDRMVLATKGGILPPVPYNSGREYLTKACDDSLRRLGVDRIDLYQIHRPDFYTHPAELAETLTSLRAAGKIVEVGISNYLPSQGDALQSHLDFALVSDQPQFSLVHTDPLRDGTLDRAMEAGLTPLAWSALGGGSLATGEGLRPELTALLDTLAEREGVDRAGVALAWILAHPSKPVALVGSQSPARLAGYARAATVSLDRSDVYGLLQAAEGAPLP